MVDGQGEAAWDAGRPTYSLSYNLIIKLYLFKFFKICMQILGYIVLAQYETLNLGEVIEG